VNPSDGVNHARPPPSSTFRLGAGAWSLEPGAWSLEPGAWSLEPGAWSDVIAGQRHKRGGSPSDPGTCQGHSGKDAIRASAQSRRGRRPNYLQSISVMVADDETLRLRFASAQGDGGLGVVSTVAPCGAGSTTRDGLGPGFRPSRLGTLAQPPVMGLVRGFDAGCRPPGSTDKGSLAQPPSP
jgi:hypothetical protein